MKLDPQREDAVSRALRNVVRAAHEATLPNDLDAVRKALNTVWWAVHDATKAINDAEQATRDEALDAVRDRHAAFLASLQETHA